MSDIHQVGNAACCAYLASIEEDEQERQSAHEYGGAHFEWPFLEHGVGVRPPVVLEHLRRCMGQTRLKGWTASLSSRHDYSYLFRN
jgi:hypothetical protein